MSFLLPKVPDTRSEGPRLSDLAVTQSAFGDVIARADGTARLPGNIIWATPLREEVIEQTVEVGGKGPSGGKATTITYKYYASFAIVFALGPADKLLRLWGESKLIFSSRRPAGKRRVRKDMVFRFYKGTENQLPDSLIESVQGAGATPAYRGLVYAVFEDVELGDFGNRIPAITAEVRFSASSGAAFAESDPATTAVFAPAGRFAVDHTLGRVYRGGGADELSVEAFTAEGTHLQTYVVDAGAVYDADARNDAHCVHPFTHEVFYITTQSIIVNIFRFHRIGRINPFTGSGYSRSANSGQNYTAGGERMPGLYGALPCVLRTPYGDFTWLVSRGADSSNFSIRIHDWDDDFNFDSLIEYSGSWLTTFVDPAPGFGLLYFGVVTSSSLVVKQFRTRVVPGLTGPVKEFDLEDVKTITPADLGVTSFSTAPGNNQTTPIWYDRVTSGILFLMNTNAGYVLFKLSEAGIIEWQRTIPVWPQLDLVSTLQLWQDGSHADNADRLSSGVLMLADGQKLFAVDTTTGDIVNGLTGVSNVLSTTGRDDQFFDGDKAAVVMTRNSSGNHRARIITLEGDSDSDVELDALVARLALDAGLSADEIDVTDLAGIFVKGYVVDSATSGAGAIEPLGRIYNFDPVEIDGKIVFKRRTDVADASVTEDDFVDATGSSFTEKRRQEAEIPRALQINYMSRANDYQVNTAQARRALTPFAAVQSQEVTTVDIPLVATGNEMKAAAERLLYTAAAERSEFSQKLPWTFLALTNADVVDVTLSNGISYQGRVSKFDVGGDFSLSTTFAQQGSEQYDDAGTEADEGSVIEDVVPSIADTLFIPLDAPYYRDNDATFRTAALYYWGGAPFSDGTDSGWRGAWLFQEIDTDLWEPISAIDGSMVVGVTVDALPDIDPNRFHYFDDDTTFEVVMLNGTLSSASDSSILAGNNILAVKKSNGEVEYVGYGEATLVAPSRYRLSRLLRAMRGTEKMANNHAAGEYFVRMTTGVGRIEAPLATIGNPTTLRPVTMGQTFEEAAPLTTSITGLGRSLMPYAPNAFAAVQASGTITFSWQNRTRVAGELRDGTDEVVLSEAAAAYDYELYDVQGGALLKSGTDVSTRSFTLSSAERVTANVTGRSTFFLRVWQKSDEVGRGFEGSGNVNVTSFLEADPGARDYWRLRITDIYATVETTRASLSEVQFRATVGGADQASGGTASAGATDGVNVAANAFDDDDGTYWRSGTSTSTRWIAYAFAAPVSVDEVAIKQRPDGVGVNEAPLTIVVEYSDDGVSWATAWTATTPKTWGDTIETRAFAAPYA